VTPSSLEGFCWRDAGDKFLLGGFFVGEMWVTGSDREIYYWRPEGDRFRLKLFVLEFVLEWLLLSRDDVEIMDKIVHKDST
jgi:hypothetical protein